MYVGVEEVLSRVYDVLEGLGYKPVVVGTYALVLQGWLLPSYVEETKDVDVYVNEAMVMFDGRLEEALLGLGLSLGRSEAGGMYVDAEKPVEIIYPIHDFYIPRTLLSRVTMVKNMRVLEGHAVIIAKAMGGSVERLANALQVRPEPELLMSLLESVADEIEPAKHRVVERRIKEFIKRLMGCEGEGGGEQ